MEKLHFISGYSAENFDLHNISDPLGESLRSKSKEHPERFTQYEKIQNSTKTKEFKS